MNTNAGKYPNRLYIALTTITGLASVIAVCVVIQIRGWLGKKVEAIWEDEVWDQLEWKKRNPISQRIDCQNQLHG
jgi:hypothetical protein